MMPRGDLARRNPTCKPTDMMARSRRPAIVFSADRHRQSRQLVGGVADIDDRDARLVDDANPLVERVEVPEVGDLAKRGSSLKSGRPQSSSRAAASRAVRTSSLRSASATAPPSIASLLMMVGLLP